MSKLPLITAKELIKLIVAFGFKFMRQRGSHKIFQHSGGRITVIPNHGKEQIDWGLLHKIIKQDLKISIEEFNKLH